MSTRHNKNINRSSRSTPSRSHRSEGTTRTRKANAKGHSKKVVRRKVNYKRVLIAIIALLFIIFILGHMVKSHYQKKAENARIERELKNERAQVSAKDKKYTVMIDPGHGGNDKGTISQDGKYFEKTFALEISKRVKEKLSRHRDINVIMTREDDEYVYLDDRVKMANEKNPDVFVSIHLNAQTQDKTATGIETWYRKSRPPKKKDTSTDEKDGSSKDGSSKDGSIDESDGSSKDGSRNGSGSLSKDTSKDINGDSNKGGSIDESDGLESSSSQDRKGNRSNSTRRMTTSKSSNKSDKDDKVNGKNSKNKGKNIEGDGSGDTTSEEEQTEVVNYSKALAQYIQSTTMSYVDTKDRGILPSTYEVIRETKSPAVLIECGFLTTKAEVDKLQNPEYIDNLAEGIAQGILAYLDNQKNIK